MAGLKEIKNKIKSVQKTSKVTKAMEAVSAVKMRKSQEKAIGARTYARSALRILKQVSSVVEIANHPLIKQSEKGDTIMILVTSDKGLAGSLNSAVLKIAENFVASKDYSKGNIKWICIGKRSGDWAKARGFDIIKGLYGVDDDMFEENMMEITKLIIEQKRSNNVRKVNIVYTNFKSTFEQEAVVRRVLPISRGTIDDIISGITPERGKFSDLSDKDDKVVADYLVEPARSKILDDILPILVNIVIFHGLLENKASEHSARMVAMKNATDKAGEVGMLLKRKFNKIRQATITAEIGEITSGIEAMK